MWVVSRLTGAVGMEPEGLKRDFGGRIVFNGAIDSHHVLINGTPESVRRSTRDVLEIMKPGGGYIAVEFASIDNMRRMEQENASKAGAHRSLKPGDVSDPSSYKVRRAKVGGWRDYVTEEQSDAIDAMVRKTLAPVYGYE